ncbi:MAG: hypothetical protein ABJ327_06900 [Litoreibacter sp.]
MTAALTLLIILAVSLFVVRLGGTALRLTGMPLDAARFQSISALTGTGFTTQEAETAMHHPLRRRVLIGLMFAGHLGVVSLASTVILAVSTAEEGAALWTILYMFFAILTICTIAMSETFDRIICGFIASAFKWLGWFEAEPHLIIAELPDGSQIAEHTSQHLCRVEVPRLDITILRKNDTEPGEGQLELNSGDTLLCFGTALAQEELSKVLKAPS